MKVNFSLDSDDVKRALEAHIAAHFGLPEGGTFEFPGDYNWKYSDHTVEYTYPASPAPTSQEDSDADL